MTSEQSADAPTKANEQTFSAGVFLEKSAQAFALVSAVSLALSIVFDMGYLESLGLNFGDVPTTIADHVRSALLWVPRVIGAIAGYFAITFLQSTFAAMGADGIGQPAQEGRKSKKLSLVLGLIFIGAAFAISNVNWLTGGWLDEAMVWAGPLTVATMVFLGLQQTGLLRSMPTLLFWTIMGAATGTFAIYYLGMHRAAQDLRGGLVATVATTEAPHGVRVGVLRYLDRGMLLKVDGAVVFYRWEDIKKVSVPITMRFRNNYLCSFTGLGCQLGSAAKPPPNSASATARQAASASTVPLSAPASTSASSPPVVAASRPTKSG